MPFANLSIEQLLGPGFDCACGRRHSCDLRILKSGAGAINTLPIVVRELEMKKPFVVCDANTYKAAGERAVALLKAAGIDHALHILPMREVEPDEHAIGSIAMAFDPSCDILLAVGSGVINDLCKEFAHALGKPSMVVGTAPSMDGYASSSSSMLVNSVKTTLYNACPVAIILDSEIMKLAPMRMLWAGLGDMLAKYISILEWRVAHLVTGEYYCPEVAELIRRSLRKCMESADKLLNRDPEVVQAVSEGLVLSGIAMSFAGISRPASGMEHYFSHMWEMMALERGEKSDLHGIQVGVGTLITLKLYDWIKTLTPDRAARERAITAFDPAKWEKKMRRIFGKTAPQIIAIEQTAHKNDPVRWAARFDTIQAHWPDILKMIDEELPGASGIEALMKRLGMPMTNRDLGISAQDTMDAYTGAREIRDKYQGVSMLWDLGLAEQARVKVGEIAQG